MRPVFLGGVKGMKYLITMVFSFILALAAATQAGQDGLAAGHARVKNQAI